MSLGGVGHVDMSEGYFKLTVPTMKNIEEKDIHDRLLSIEAKDIHCVMWGNGKNSLGC